MTGAIACADREFRVGDVRAVVWTNPIHQPDLGKYTGCSVTVERLKKTGQGGPVYTSVLDGGDIPKAILALKRAHNFIQACQREEAKRTGFKSAEQILAERIP